MEEGYDDMTIVLIVLASVYAALLVGKAMLALSYARGLEAEGVQLLPSPLPSPEGDNGSNEVPDGRGEPHSALHYDEPVRSPSPTEDCESAHSFPWERAGVRASPELHPLPPNTLTIVQPILSGDPSLESRLDTNLTALPEQSFLWLIDEDDTEAKRISHTLAARHPSTSLRVELCPPCPEATSPKLWKLQRAATLTDTPIFCVLDDDTTMSAASAAALVAAATGHTITTGLPCYLASPDTPSRLLSQFVNNSSIFTYLATSQLLSAFTVNGMGYILRREDLPRLKNFEPIVHELTDDLALATLVLRSGGNIRQSTAPLFVKTSVKDFTHYMQLMHRWYVFTLLLMRRQSVPVQLLIFGLHGLQSFLLIAMFVLATLSLKASSWLILAAVLGLRGIVLTTLLRHFFVAGLHSPVLSIVSELVQPVHLIHALTCRTIRWRTRLYKVRDTNDFTAL